MLAFVTALPHPHNTRSYARVSELLAGALASVAAQTCDRFTVFVVGNRRPTVELPTGAHFVGVEFAPAHPRAGPVPRDGVLEYAIPDKGVKLAAGVLAARRVRPRHLMCFDYDDRLSRHLAAHCAEHRDAPGWYAEQGYVYWRGSCRITPVDGFSEICGSSFILSEELLRTPEGLDERSSAERIFGELGEAFVLELLARHVKTRGYLRQRGIELEPLPFPAAVWLRGTGENASSWAGYPSLLGTPVSDEIRADFGLVEAARGSPMRDLVGFPAQALGAYPILLRHFGWRRTIAMATSTIARRLFHRVAPRG